ncbi:hypothetical protein FGO68_gene2055 [Halteria grandinella]|uniref:J domain-containing protein n=1 Tax=Halteria grandinella TaxID=5974 RepID=A0A8J8P5B5_HALGN|nr:hypothetical protein FGO68_gene2055 [Halteria grandinella]
MLKHALLYSRSYKPLPIMSQRCFTIPKKQPPKHEEHKTAEGSQPPEKVFDYASMDHYQLLEVSITASDVELKKAYLKLAKKYHPDLYKGVNKDHFKKVLDAYNTLKNPAKRSDYDKHSRIKSMKNSKDYQDYEHRMRQEGRDFSHEMYEEMKKQAQKEKTVRETVDPEFEAAFRKLNLNRLFNEFNARPMRSNPEELHDNIMVPVARQKMNKKDLLRLRFVQQHRLKREGQRTLRNQITVEIEKMRDFQEGITATKKMTYAELVEDLNKDLKAIEQMEKPLQLFKDEAAQVAAIKKQQDESLQQVKKVVWPLWAIFITFNSILMYAYSKQKMQIQRNSEKIAALDKFQSYQ